MNQSSLGPLAVDAHVHFHGCFNEERFFNRAHENLRRGALARGADSFVGVLCFTESAGVDHFSTLRQRGRTIGGSWKLVPTGEDVSLIAENERGHCLVLVAGRQLVTAEGLEVLAVGVVDAIPDRLPIKESILRASQANALVIIPWGFGKWWLRRGRLLADLLVSEASASIHLGDNCGRMMQLGEPRHFRLARTHHRFILPGSDPLPFPSHEGNAGRCGFWLDAQIHRQRPAADLRQLLLSTQTQPFNFGQYERPVRFIQNQFAMQLRKRFAFG